MSELYSSPHCSVKDHTSSNSGPCVTGQDQQLSHSRISWDNQISTVSNFDRLKVGFLVEFKSEVFMEKLAEGKALARELNSPFALSFSSHGDQVYMCHATGRKGGFAYHLSRGDVHIFISRRNSVGKTPNVYVDIGSESCWAPGYQFIISEIKSLLADQDGHILKEKLSEVHFCTDALGFDLEEIPIDFKEYWITRAEKFATFENREQIEGVQIGKGNLVLRIYDKVLELMQSRDRSKQFLFASAWDQPEYDERPVTRIEFQVRREILRSFNVNTLDDLETKKRGLWQYLTKDWARLSLDYIDRENRHQDRATIHPFWAYLQEVDWDTSPCEVVRKHKRASTDWQTKAELIAAHGLSIAVLLERKPEDLEGTIAFAQGALEYGMRQLWKRRKTKSGDNEFIKRMKSRWSDIWPMGCEPAPLVPMKL